jgi:hypothetical protein
MSKKLTDILKDIFGFLPSLLDVTSLKEEVSKEVMENLSKKFPEIPLNKLEEIVNTFLELLREESYRLVPSSQKSQEQKIQGSVTKAICKHFQLPEEVAKNVVFHLLYQDNREKLAEQQVPFNEIELVKNSLLGIDVLYKRLSVSQWEYTTRIFIKSADETSKYENTDKLSPDSLPNNVRKAFFDKGEEKQRFVLYPSKEK